MNISKTLKKNRVLNKIGKAVNIYREYIKDAVFFLGHYSDSSDNQKQLEYKMLFFVHSIEKGMCMATRPFGRSKIAELRRLIEVYTEHDFDTEATAFMMAVEAIRAWLDVFEEKGWECPERDELKPFIEQYTNTENQVEVGFEQMNKAQLTCEFPVDSYLDFVTSRRTVRDFENKPLADSDVEECVLSAIHTPSACNRQMVSVIQVTDESRKKLLSACIKGIAGINTETVTYFLITYDTASLMFYGERSQGMFNAGLFAMNFVNALHSKGIGSCIMQWSNPGKESSKVEKELSIPDGTKIACVIGAGYYSEQSNVPYSFRKPIAEIFRKV